MAGIKLVYFSPTGSTKKIVQTMGSAWGEIEALDVTAFAQEETIREFAKEDVVIFGVPSFGGRVPEAAVKRFSHMKGNGARAVALTAFGNRAYDDTLRELAALLSEQGFCVVAAVAAVAEHSIAHKYGAGRPDANDLAELKDYARRIAELGSDAATVAFDSAEPYREYGGVPLKPHADKRCTACGVCAAHCPVGAILSDHPAQTNEERCISCMGCISVCPAGARSLNKMMLFGVEKMLKKACETPKKNELILG